MDGNMDRPSYRDARTHLKENVQSNSFILLSFMKKSEKRARERERERESEKEQEREQER